MEQEGKIKSIDIVMENCEVISIPASDIENLILSEIESTVAVNSFQYKDGEVFRSRTAHYFRIIISKDKIVNKVAGFIFSFDEDTDSFIDYMNRRNITGINLVYSKKKIERYLVDWNCEDEYTNRYQHVIESDQGVMVVIDKEFKEEPKPKRTRKSKDNV